jgi:hypothetical protein
VRWPEAELGGQLAVKRAGSTITKFRIARAITSTDIRTMPLPRWVEPQSGDENVVR